MKMMQSVLRRTAQYSSHARSVVAPSAWTSLQRTFCIHNNHMSNASQFACSGGIVEIAQLLPRCSDNLPLGVHRSTGCFAEERLSFAGELSSDSVATPGSHHWCPAADKPQLLPQPESAEWGDSCPDR